MLYLFLSFHTHNAQHSHVSDQEAGAAINEKDCHVIHRQPRSTEPRQSAVAQHVEPGTCAPHESACGPTVRFGGRLTTSSPDPRRHSHDGGKFKTKPRAPANTFRYIYTCQKNYTGWVRSHIGEGSSAHLRTFKAYVEMRDAKMMTRLNEVAHQNGRNMNFHSSGIVQGARPQGGASAEYTVQQMVVPPLPIRSPPPQTPSQRSVQSWQVVSAAPCSTYAPPSPSPKMTAGSMGRRRRMRDDDMEVDANRAKKIQDTWTVWTMELMNKNEEAREHVEKETMWLQNSAGGPQKVARMFSRLAVQGTNLQLQEEDQ